MVEVNITKNQTMDEEVQIMGNAQDEIPKEVYKELAEEWVAEIAKYDVFELLELDKRHLRVGIMDKAEELGLNEAKEDDLIIAVEGLKMAIEGRGVSNGLLPEDVSKAHIYDKPMETKLVVQEIAKKALRDVRGRDLGGRGR